MRANRAARRSVLDVTMMTDKRNKYDTDPLDPEFARRRTEEMSGDSATGGVAGERPTERIHPGNVGAEDTTRQLDGTFGNSYPSVFVPPTYQPPPSTNYTTFGSESPPQQVSPLQQQQPRTPFVAAQQQQQQKSPPTSRTLPGLGIPENIAMVLPYAPFYIGIIASIIELLLVPRSEYRVRFHAAQGFALQLAILLISFLFTILGSVTGSNFGGWLFGVASFIFLIVSMIRVWNGDEHRLAPLQQFARPINEKFEPRK